MGLPGVGSGGNQDLFEGYRVPVMQNEKKNYRNVLFNIVLEANNNALCSWNFVTSIYLMDCGGFLFTCLFFTSMKRKRCVWHIAKLCNRCNFGHCLNIF